jgi:uncharacterized Ntn-hydrolase superfamily protein
VAHFDKGSADRNSVLSVEEKGTDFGFRGRSCDSTQRFAEDMDGAVWLGAGGLLVAEERVVRKK